MPIHVFSKGPPVNKSTSLTFNNVLCKLGEFLVPSTFLIAQKAYNFIYWSFIFLEIVVGR